MRLRFMYFNMLQSGIRITHSNHSFNNEALLILYSIELNNYSPIYQLKALHMADEFDK